MNRLRNMLFAGAGGLALLLAAVTIVWGVEEDGDRHVKKLTAEGRQTFRYDTFGDEAFWGGALQLHKAIAEVSPKTALSVGLKVDSEALPEAVKEGLRRGAVNLDDPATTAALLKLNAVVGVTGFFDGDGKMTSVGIQCALCHSTVDDSFAPSVGRRLDGWPNRDLNVGAIVALSPDLRVVRELLGVDDATVRTVLRSWGPGKFDAQLFLDGKAFRPDGKSAATLIPSAYGLAGVNMGTATGFGSTTYWNAFVATLEMHGKGRFFDPRLKDPERFPVAAKSGFFDVKPEEDRATGKLAALHFYQLGLAAPVSPEAGRPFDFASRRGKELFAGKAKCGQCHVPPLFTEPGYNMHTAEEIGIDDFQAKRSPTGLYRTAPLAGIWARGKGGYYHDGRFAGLREVVEHYDGHLKTGLTEEEKADLVAYLRTL